VSSIEAMCDRKKKKKRSVPPLSREKGARVIVGTKEETIRTREGGRQKAAFRPGGAKKKGLETPKRREGKASCCRWRGWGRLSTSN